MTAIASQITDKSTICSTIGEGNIKAPQYLPFVWESTDHPWISSKKGLRLLHHEKPTVAVLISSDLC